MNQQQIFENGLFFHFEGDFTLSDAIDYLASIKKITPQTEVLISYLSAAIDIKKHVKLSNKYATTIHENEILFPTYFRYNGNMSRKVNGVGLNIGTLLPKPTNVVPIKNLSTKEIKNSSSVFYYISDSKLFDLENDDDVLGLIEAGRYKMIENIEIIKKVMLDGGYQKVMSHYRTFKCDKIITKFNKWLEENNIDTGNMVIEENIPIAYDNFAENSMQTEEAETEEKIFISCCDENYEMFMTNIICGNFHLIPTCYHAANFLYYEIFEIMHKIRFRIKGSDYRNNFMSWLAKVINNDDDNTGKNKTLMVILILSGYIDKLKHTEANFNLFSYVAKDVRTCLGPIDFKHENEQHLLAFKDLAVYARSLNVHDQIREWLKPFMHVISQCNCNIENLFEIVSYFDFDNNYQSIRLYKDKFRMKNWSAKTLNKVLKMNLDEDVMIINNDDALLLIDTIANYNLNEIEEKYKEKVLPKLSMDDAITSYNSDEVKNKEYNSPLMVLVENEEYIEACHYLDYAIFNYSFYTVETTV